MILDKSLFRTKEIMKSYGDPNELRNELEWSSKILFNEIIEKLIESHINYS